MNWLEVKENLIFFENYTNILKYCIKNTFMGNEETINMSKYISKKNSLSLNTLEKETKNKNTSKKRNLIPRSRTKWSLISQTWKMKCK